MFDVGFSEIFVIALVALIVIGPERLPKVARTLGHLLGRMQRYVSDVKADINREMELEELKKMRDSVQKTATSFENSVQSEVAKVETDVNAATGDLAKKLESDVGVPEPSPVALPEAGKAPEKTG